MNLRPRLIALLASLLHRQVTSSSLDGNTPAKPLEAAPRQIMPERRAHPRRYGDPVEVHIQNEEHGIPYCGRVGWIRDRSLGGLGLSVEWPADVGTKLRVRPSFVPDEDAWVEVAVRHYHQQGNRWIVGCQFVEQPRREVMLLFR